MSLLPYMYLSHRMALLNMSPTVSSVKGASAYLKNNNKTNRLDCLVTLLVLSSSNTLPKLSSSVPV